MIREHSNISLTDMGGGDYESDITLSDITMSDIILSDITLNIRHQF